MVGGFAFGILSDERGRKQGFNITLFLTALFGAAMTFSPNYTLFCISGCLLGIGLGGNLPIAGNLFFESVGREALLTLLSIFWTIGNLVSASLGWTLLPRFSCPHTYEVENTSWIRGNICFSEDNRGWRYLLFSHAVMNILFWIGNCFVFRIYESLKYLLARGNTTEALEILNVLATVARRDLRPIHSLFNTLLIDIFFRKTG